MVISKIIRKNKKFVVSDKKKINPLESKLSMTELIIEFIKKNPDCKRSDLYKQFPDWDQGHIRSKVRRLVETHRVVERLRVEEEFKRIIH